MKFLIKNAHLVDPVNKIDGRRDILIQGTRIARVENKLSDASAKIIDAQGKIVMPGLVDMHVHLREPGREDKETILSGTSAALKGGVTSCLVMPNTEPAMDSPANIKLLKKVIKQTARMNVFIAAALTKERQGLQAVNISSLKKEGALAFSDDGSSVDSDKVFLDVAKQARKAKSLIICHSEDTALSAGGTVNLGPVSTRMGLKGISRQSEYERVERDIQLASKAASRVHIAHVSCAESVEIIRRAKKKGVAVTAETAPHYFALTESAVLGFDTSKKMNPPLRRKEDLEAIKQGLKNGVLDAIASDHAPHTENEKDIEFEYAEFGTIGLETELSASITYLITPGILTWSDLVCKLSLNPSRILGLDKGNLAPGKDADLIIVDPNKQWTVGKESFISKSKNSAFLGAQLQGEVEYTFCKGEIAYFKEGKI